MQRHVLSLDHRWFMDIKKGDKVYELRTDDEKRKKIKTDDIIIFQDTETNETMEKTVKKIYRYQSFSEALQNLPKIELALPGIVDLDKAVELYRAIPGYVEKEQQYGIVVFKVICRSI